MATGLEGGRVLDRGAGIDEVWRVDGGGSRTIYFVSGQSAGRTGLDAGGKSRGTAGGRSAVSQAVANDAADVWRCHGLVLGE